MTWRLSTLARASEVKLRIKNGYQKSKKLFDANAAPRDVEITLLGPRGVVATQRASLARRMGWQDVVIAVPQGVALDGVRLTVRSTWPGRVYKDTCISDVETWVKTDVPYNAKAENAKRARLLAWVRARRGEAEYFKQLPPEYPFATTHFTTTPLLALDDRRVPDADSGILEEVKGWRLDSYLRCGASGC